MSDKKIQALFYNVADRREYGFYATLIKELTEGNVKTANEKNILKQGYKYITNMGGFRYMHECTINEFIAITEQTHPKNKKVKIKKDK